MQYEQRNSARGAVVKPSAKSTEVTLSIWSADVWKVASERTAMCGEQAVVVAARGQQVGICRQQWVAWREDVASQRERAGIRAI